MPPRNEAGRQVRMQDVARRANVSHMTVSRALRSPEKVSEAARQAIEQAIRETGYVHNHLASSLASNRTTVVAAIIPSITHSSLEPTIETLMAALRTQGLHLLLGTSGDTDANEAAMIGAMLAQRPCAMVLHNTRHTAAARTVVLNAGIPVLEAGDLLRRPLDLCVSYSNRAAVKAMVLHLAGQGYRAIAIASVASRVNDRSRQRLAGFRDGLRAAGLPWADERLIETAPGFGGGAAAVDRIVQDRRGVDALFCSTGILALGALAALRRHGWDVPGRIGLAGFEDSEFMESASPPLTTIRIPRALIGERAADLLLRCLAGDRPQRPVVDVGFEIVPRLSTQRC